ncbi:DoxX family protein [Knoellia koreensis]|uniref:DoxX family protein n=1 Tax=Knoellia koreensis TaxID=2730921 RepID=A0A849HRJ4_9MICO|nr:DoxX family protein [Knoellia sp. DB2414S]
MTITTIILSALLGLGFFLAGTGKLRRAEPVTGTLESLGVTPSLQKTVGALEVLGAIGVVIGLWLQPLGIAAAIGLVLMMIGALVFHVRARDTFKGSVGALVLLVLGAVVLAFQFATA